MEKKMTVKQKFEEVRKVIAGSDAANKNELMEFIDERIKMQEKKTGSNSKKNAEIEAKVEEVYKALVEMGRPATATEIGDKVGFSNQRTSAYLKKLVDENKVEKFAEKRVSYFKVINENE